MRLIIEYLINFDFNMFLFIFLLYKTCWFFIGERYERDSSHIDTAITETQTQTFMQFTF